MIKSISHKEIISQTPENIIPYHGRANIGGIGLAYRAAEFIQNNMFRTGHPIRGKFSFNTAFTGLGFSDTFEAAYRTETYRKYNMDKLMIVPAKAPSPDGGNFYFEAFQDEGFIKFIAVKEIFSPVYYKMMKKSRTIPLTPEESADIMLARENAYIEVMQSSGEDIFKIVDLKTCDGELSSSKLEIKECLETFEVWITGNIHKIRYEDIIKYHGTEAICGATLIFKLFCAVSKMGIKIERGKTALTLGVIGAGIKDASRYILRNAVTVDRDFGASFNTVAAPGGFEYGAFVFKITTEGKSHTFGLKESIYPVEYMKLATTGKTRELSQNELEEKRFYQLKFAEDLINTQNVFEVMN